MRLVVLVVLAMSSAAIAQERPYAHLTVRQIAASMAAFCPPVGEPPCKSEPPAALVDEAARRGLIQRAAPAQAPQSHCLLGAVGDDAVTLCD